MKKTFIALALMLTVSLATVSCGDTKKETTENTEATADSTATTVQTAPAADTSATVGTTDTAPAGEVELPADEK